MASTARRVHRRPDNPRWRKPTRLRRRVFHRDHPTWDADSYRGLRAALRWLFRWIDLNFCVTRDGQLVNFHWPRPLLHGYRDPLGELPRHRHVGHMSSSEALRLVSPAGDAVHTAEQMIRRAGRLGLDVELEVKPGCRPVAYLHACSIVDAARASGVELVVKTLTSPGGAHAAVARLEPFHRAGATTCLLPRGSRRVPRSAWAVVDHVRGPVIWTGPNPHKEHQ